jgi:CHAT domain-containing protein
LAHIGYIRATFETRSFAETAHYFVRTCAEPIVASDPELHFKCLIAKGDTDAEIDSAPAEADWRGVRALAQSLHNQKWVNRATGEIGFARYVEGDHTTAKRNTAIALLQCRKTADWAGEIRFASGIGTGLVLGGFPNLGMPYLNGASKLAHGHPESGYPYMATAGQTMALIQKADYDKAEILALEQSQRAAADNRLVKFTQAQLFLADIAIGRGQRTKAIEILTHTLDIAQRNHTRLLREVYSKLSDLYRQQGNLKRAEHYAESALTACQYSHDMYLAPSILLTIGRMKLALGKDDQAGALLQRATDIIEGMLSHTTEVHARDAMLATMSNVYKTHFALAAKHNNVNQAFAIMEQVRGRFTSELLVNKKELRDLDDTNAELEDQISLLKLQLVKATNEKQRRAIADRLFYTEQARWVQLRNTGLRHARVPLLRQFRSELPSGQLFLEYVLGDDASYCLVVSKAETRIVRLAGQQLIQADATKLLDVIRDGRDDQASGRALFRVLVEPLGDLSQYASVEISPDGILNTVPFEALRTQKGAYWGFKSTITYIPSAGTHVLLAGRTQPKSSRAFLGFGAVPYDSDVRTKRPPVSSRGNAADPYDLSDVHNLPSSGEEIRSAAALLAAQPATLDVGKNASKANFQSANLSEYAVIHFAVHARADVSNPDLSYLLLDMAPPNSDGFLQPRDIMERNLKSAVVMLSACDTGIGHLQGEEGVANLSRSFLIAGSSSVISTLWKVDDTYSLFLTKEFYQHLSGGESAGDSLKAAKMAVVAKFGQNTPPKYWAGFILTGNGNVQLPKRPENIEAARLGERRNY